VKLVNYISDGIIRGGVVEGTKVYEFNALGVREAETVDEVLSRGLLGQLQAVVSKGLAYLSGTPLSSVQLLSPVLSPEKILLVAVNYVSHTKEQAVKPPAEPYFFTKFKSSIVGPDQLILIPKISQKPDWEVELAVVVGKEGKYIEKGQALEYVAGYAISNDVSFRDLQFPPGWPERLNPLGQNWVKGKALDSSFPLGPWLVTKDEIPDPQALDLSLSVNGQVRQKSNSKEMIFHIDRLIEYASAGITLKPGDIISTGTPLGVAAFTDQRYLKDGDVVEATIEKIGTLRNPVRSEKQNCGDCCL